MTSILHNLGIVVIGRNEGERLEACLRSLPRDLATVYVDSGSRDESVKVALAKGIDVLELDPSIPFSAARARNEGFARLMEATPDLTCVQFLDGDCELVAEWVYNAVSFFDSSEGIAAICGRLRERHPEHSIYNWLCDREWDGPIGEIDACGGNVMMLAKAFRAVGGFRETMIAGEEADLCIRLRRAGWKIRRIDGEMALHDAAILKFSQWWRRSIRSGYAFAQGAHLHGRGPEQHWTWESRRAIFWGVCLPVAIGLVSATLGRLALLIWLLYPAQILRQTLRNPGTLKDRAILAIFQTLSRFPESWGEIKFVYHRALKISPRLIEHKELPKC